jgi:hypothetical protein
MARNVPVRGFEKQLSNFGVVDLQLLQLIGFWRGLCIHLEAILPMG